MPMVAIAAFALILPALAVASMAHALQVVPIVPAVSAKRTSGAHAPTTRDNGKSRTLDRAGWTAKVKLPVPVNVHLISIICLIRLASVSIANGLVIICIPGSRDPLPTAALWA